MRFISAIQIMTLSVLAGCVPEVQIQTEPTPNTDFSRLKTFAWQESDISYTGARDPDTARRVQNVIRSSIVTGLQDKGFVQVNKQPDFLVSYHVVVTEEEDPMLTEEEYVIFGNPASNPNQSYTIHREDLRVGQGSIRRGTLIVFIADAKTQRLLWQGIAVGTALSPRDALKKSGDAIHLLLEAFPPP